MSEIDWPTVNVSVQQHRERCKRIVDTIGCPLCGAEMGKRCRTAGGNSYAGDMHEQRKRAYGVLRLVARQMAAVS